MGPPTAFSNELEKWVFHKYNKSMIFCQFRKNKNGKLKELWDVVAPIKEKGAKKGAADNKREAYLQKPFCSSGFVVKVDESETLILTCAHVLESSFNQKRPITAPEVEKYFDVSIICDHHEDRYQSNVVTERDYVEARVQAISCDMDLMLLAVPRNVLESYCAESHAAIPMATAYPEDPLEKVVMLSWPPLRNKTAVSGETCYPSRPISSLSLGNPHGFTCRLAEVNITSEPGSSGAPLITGAGEFVSVLHGGYGSGFSFFTSFEDVRTTLVSWGVLDADQVV